MRAYADPTADMAIGNVMREWREQDKFQMRTQHGRGRTTRFSLPHSRGGAYETGYIRSHGFKSRER